MYFFRSIKVIFASFKSCQTFNQLDRESSESMKIIEEKTLSFDIFSIVFKEFEKPPNEFNPHKLTFASSINTTLTIIASYILILFIGKM